MGFSGVRGMFFSGRKFQSVLCQYVIYLIRWFICIILDTSVKNKSFRGEMQCSFGAEFYIFVVEFHI